jgi:hypothetical protein
METSGEVLARAVRAPAYIIADASRLSKVAPWTATRWLRGYEYSYFVDRGTELRRGQMPPVVQRKPIPGRTYASFLELIDLVFVKKFLEQGVSLQKLRKALDEVSRARGEVHFVHEVFFTEGSNVYWEDSGETIIKLVSGGQMAFRRIVEDLYARIEFDSPSKLPRRYFPLGKGAPIVVDALVGFGRPTILGRGVATANVYDLYLAEEENLGATSSWLGVTEPEAAAAIRFEAQLAA